MKTPAFACVAFVWFLGTPSAADLPLVTDVDLQPLLAQVGRVVEAADLLGVPFSADEKSALDVTALKSNADVSIAKIQAVLDSRCLFAVTINPEMRVKVAPGPAKAELVEQGWRPFFIKVIND